MSPQVSASQHESFQAEDVPQHLATLRAAQRGVGKFVGRVKELSAEHSAILAAFLSENSVVIAGQEADTGFRDACDRLLSRYLELARRRGMTPQCAECCSLVFKELVGELRQNCLAFELPPGKLVTATLLSQQPLRALTSDPELTSFIRRFPSIVERAVTSRPADPLDYVRDVAARLSASCDGAPNPEAHRLSDFTTFVLAKTHREMPPGERLALFRRQLESLLNSDECKLLTGVFSKDSARTRFIERLLTRFKVEECRAYLSEAAKLYREICEDESFAWLQHRRADILVAIERYGKTTKEFLSAMLVQEGRIAVMAEACGERLTPKQLRVLCLRTPRKAAAFEDALRQRCPRSGTESIGDPPQ